MKILVKVLIKQVLTDKSRKKLRESFARQIGQLETECRQLQFEMKKLQKNEKMNRGRIAERFNEEIERRMDKIKKMEFNLDELDRLPDGSELIQEESETYVDVSVGDKWDSITKDRSIIVKDGVIVAIE
ncbi:YlqD family protein [Bacillus marinisedimentorum]|uniref:YlqD family protein n=1 Tax=Bacillus marinisedimentorum TaxID=1821260 RepID=UPI0007DF09EC|nr:YlqD family protein [Bacillus marinisedimentorum]